MNTCDITCMTSHGLSPSPWRVLWRSSNLQEHIETKLRDFDAMKQETLTTKHHVKVACFNQLSFSTSCNYIHHTSNFIMCLECRVAPGLKTMELPYTWPLYEHWHIYFYKSLRMLVWMTSYLQDELEMKLQDFYKSAINDDAMKWDL